MDLQKLYLACRRQTEKICDLLEIEDYIVQSIPDVSPPKWHLAHTTWFFETFVVAPLKKNYQPDVWYQHLFNSYYQSVSTPFQRDKRGLLSRPTVKEVYAYRQRIDAMMTDILNTHTIDESLAHTIALGINHEQQHQELLLMDIKHNLFIHPQFPVYKKQAAMHAPTQKNKKKAYDSFDGGIISVGFAGETFCYDNELPRHHMLLHPFQIANCLVTNGDYLAFIEDNGYTRPSLWLDDGWQWRLSTQQQAPLYWVKRDKSWYQFSLYGLQPLSLDEPVAHITYYEADAYARWQDARLPTEYEWEYAVRDDEIKDGVFLEQAALHPVIEQDKHAAIGNLWVWTSSAYLPYPRYQPLAGSLGEYNGKFMNNQIVLRGGSFATPSEHYRISYRNFFQPNKAWQFSGIRLAKNLKE